MQRVQRSGCGTAYASHSLLLSSTEKLASTLNVAVLCCVHLCYPKLHAIQYLPGIWSNSH